MYSNPSQATTQSLNSSVNAPLLGNTDHSMTSSPTGDLEQLVSILQQDNPDVQIQNLPISEQIITHQYFRCSPDIGQQFLSGFDTVHQIFDRYIGAIVIPIALG